MAGLLTLVGTGVGAYFGGPAGAAAGAGIGAMIEGSQGQEQANATNKRIAEDNRDFQAQMSNTAFQRATADLRAAGLNPLLATGAQASTPAGSTATMENAASSFQTGAKDIATAAAIGQQAQKQNSEIGVMDAQRKNLEAQTLKTNVETAVAKKGIPEAEIKNDVYDLLRPAVKKAKEAFLTGSGTSIRSKENAQKFFQPNYGRPLTGGKP